MNIQHSNLWSAARRLHALPSLALFAHLTYAFGTTIEGDVWVTGYTRQGTVTYKVPITFSAAIDVSGRWQVTAVYGTNYEEICGTDKECTYSVMRWMNPRRGTTPVASIVDGTHPYFSEATTRVVWLAFASSSYFETDTNPLPALWNVMFNNPMSHALEMTCEFLPPPGKLPSKVDFTFSRKMVLGKKHIPFLMRNLTSTEIKRDVNRAKAVDGKLVAQYRVLETTNFSGTSLPMGFSLDVLGYDHGHRFILQSYRGTVERIRPEVPVSFVPKIAGPLSVQDYRFFDDRARLDRIDYMLTNGNWLPTNEPILQDLFLRRKAALAALVPKVEPGTGATLTIAFLLFVVLSFPILVWRLNKGWAEKKASRT